MKKFAKIIQFAIIVMFCFGFIAHAQDCQGANFPFPQNAVYLFGIMPDGRDSAYAENSYMYWKNTYVTAEGANGFRRVLWDDMSSTVSEGIGYGMLLAANYNDKDLFDDLWCYYNLHLDVKGLMHWRIGSNGHLIGENAATDADEDVAFALILADRQWSSQGEDYLQHAINMINKIFQHEVEAGTYVLKPGDAFGGSDVTNPSYFAPAYYRVFKSVTGNTEWDNVISKCYEILQNSTHERTGLVPDWCDANGAEVSTETEERHGRNFDYDYTYDAVRTPYRIALDYIWFGNEEAHNFCNTITNFANGIGTSNIVDGYQLDGTPTPTPISIEHYHNSAFVGTFAVGSMATTYQQYCNESYIDNVQTWGDNYYTWSLRTLTLFLQTGNFFNPLQPVPPGDCICSISMNETVSGSWSSDCESTHRSGKYAKYYTFSLPSTTEVQIDLESSVDTYLYLLSGSGMDGSEITHDDDGGSGYNSRIVTTLSSGTYTIEATTYSSGRTGDFTLSLTETGSPPPSPPGDCICSISMNETVSGSWSSDCESTHRSGKYAKYYTFSLPSTTEVQIDLESSVDTYLYLLSGSGMDGSEITHDDDGGSGYNSRIVTTLSSGTYTIEATTYSSGRTGDFTLSLAFQRGI